jgi:hypothetical protein
MQCLHFPCLQPISQYTVGKEQYIGFGDDREASVGYRLHGYVHVRPGGGVGGGELHPLRFNWDLVAAMQSCIYPSKLNHESTTRVSKIANQ